MTTGRVEQWIVRLIPLVALAAASGYLIVYLYRWEWHRALVAGVFMIAIEVGVGFAILLDRLRQLETRLTDAEKAAAVTTRDALHTTAPPPGQPFEWLSEAANRTSVFVPILLGAGVAISGLAWLLERLARVTAGTVLERGLALRLQPLTVPAGVLGGRSAPLPALPARQPTHPVRVLAIVGGLAAVILGGGTGMDALQDATKNRPDVHTQGSSGTIVLRVDTEGVPLSGVATATSLWGACVTQIGTVYRLTGVTETAAGTVELAVAPSVGKFAERRLRGCFEDATTDRLRAEVVAITASPPAP